MTETACGLTSFLFRNSHLSLSILTESSKETFIMLGGILSLIIGLFLTIVVITIIIKWNHRRVSNNSNMLDKPLATNKITLEYRHYTRLTSQEPLNNNIEISAALQAYIKDHRQHRRAFPLYAFHSFDTKKKKCVAQALIELAKINSTLYVILVKNSARQQLRIPERFIYYKIFKDNGAQANKIVFVFSKDPQQNYYSQLNSILSYKAALSLPGFNLKKITSRQKAHFTKDLKKYGIWLKVKMSSITSFQGLNFALYTTEKLNISSGMQYWFQALNFSPLYRIGESFWLFYAYFSQMLLGIFFAAIVAYAGRIAVAGFVVISIFYFITYILERYSLPLLKLKIAEEVNRDIVFYRRADTRVSQHDHGSLWQKRIQNYDANKNLVRFFKYFSILNIIMVFLFFLLIPHKTFLPQSILKYIPSFSPLQYLIFFLLWWFMDNAVSIYGELYWKELATAEIITGEEAVKKGLSKYSNIIEGVSDFFTFLVSTAGFLLGFGIAVLHIQLLIVLMLGFGVLVSIASGFILPIAMPAFNYYLVVHAENFFDSGTDNEIILHPGLKIILHPKKIGLRHAVPVDFSTGKTWLPAVEDLRPILIYQEKPHITLNWRRVIISSGASIPIITLNRTRGFFFNLKNISIEHLTDDQGKKYYAVGFF